MSNAWRGKSKIYKQLGKKLSDDNLLPFNELTVDVTADDVATEHTQR